MELAWLLFPSPSWGGVRGGGCVSQCHLKICPCGRASSGEGWTLSHDRLNAPTPNPSPRGGGGMIHIGRGLHLGSSACLVSGGPCYGIADLQNSAAWKSCAARRSLGRKLAGDAAGDRFCRTARMVLDLSLRDRGSRRRDALR